ncbi:MAG: hypothetical protein L6R28_07180 [Planctomycetes bacterium]|nr:hypothetical protein [Planctomycetota bacterium]
MDNTKIKDLLQGPTSVENAVAHWTALDRLALALRLAIVEKDPPRIGLAVLKIVELGGRPIQFPHETKKRRVATPLLDGVAAESTQSGQVHTSEGDGQ